MRTTDAARAHSRKRRGVVAAAAAAMVLMSSGSMAIFPLLPALQTTLQLSTAAIGYLAAAGFGAALLAELFLAPMADRGHARVMGVVGVLLMVLALAGSALASEPWMLVAGRAAGGLGFGLFTAAASALLVRAYPDRSGELLGKLSAAELAGVSIGPLATGVATGFGAPGPILGAMAGAVALALVPVLLGFREPPAPLDPAVAETPLPARTSLSLLRSRRVVGIVLLYAAVMVPMGAYDGIWPRFMADLGADPVLTALSYTVFAVPYVLLAGWAGRLADRRGGVAAFVRGLLVLVPIIALYAVVANPWVATGLGFVESSGQALSLVGAAAAMAQAVPAARAGASQGLLRAMGLLAATVSAAGSGVVYGFGGPGLLFGGTAVVVVALTGIGLGVRATHRANLVPRNDPSYVVAGRSRLRSPR